MSYTKVEVLYSQQEVIVDWSFDHVDFNPGGFRIRIGPLLTLANRKSQLTWAKDKYILINVSLSG